MTNFYDFELAKVRHQDLLRQAEEHRRAADMAQKGIPSKAAIRPAKRFSRFYRGVVKHIFAML